MTAVALKLHPTLDLFQEDFARHAGDLPGAGLAWLDARRAQAMEAFAKTGVPTRRVEAWKYTDLTSILEERLESSPPCGTITAGNPFDDVAGAEFLLVGGFLQNSADANLPTGIEAFDLGTIDARAPDWVRDNFGLMAVGAEQPLGAASFALMRGGLAIHVARGTEASLHLRFVIPKQERATVSHARVLLVVDEGASLKLFESHAGQGTEQTLANLGMEIHLGAGSNLDHVRLQSEGPSAVHVTTIGASLMRDAEYRALYSALGARLSRLDVQLHLDAPGAHATLHNIAVLSDGIADATTVMDHAKPRTTSRQLFKSVVGGHGRSVHQGRVTVREGAVKSDSHQLFKALLLSPRAEADAKPELEIFADDVICGHGTAIGALEQDALFYLRSRGIPEAEARGLLVRAFLGESIETIADVRIQDILWQRVDSALASLEQSAA
jgi:Fe-S cluster assembly protein SufD